MFYHTVSRSDLNLKSQDTIAHDPLTHGAMLVPVIAESDKTIVSVATGHQKYHPVYISPGIFTNTACRGHGNAVLPVAFLPIPKSMSYLLFHFLSLVSDL
jgi:Plavaka transposase